MDDARGSPQFLEEVSHSLRSPLTSLITYLSLMERRIGEAARADGAQDSLRALADLEAAALADALHMGEELDRLLARPTLAARPPRSSTRAPEKEGMGDRRFDRHWDVWDERLRLGETRLDMLKGMTEHELAELLGADAGLGRKLERNILATELTNRLSRRGRPSSDPLVASMARLLTQASRTSSDTRRIVADSTRARLESAQGRAERSTRASSGEGREPSEA